MKTILRSCLAPLCAGSLLTAIAQAPAAPASSVVSAEPTSFHQVTAKLDPGGSLYAYLSTAQCCAHLADKIGAVREFVLGQPGLGEPERQKATQIFTLIERLVRASGLESVAGVGLSGLALEPGLYRTRLVVQRAAGSEAGYLWRWFGTRPHRLDGLDWLPADTVYAVFGDLDALGVWTGLTQEAEASQLKELQTGMQRISTTVEQATGRSLEDQLRSLAGEAGVVLVLDPARKIQVPLPGGGQGEFPEPALLVALKVKDNALFDWIDGQFAQHAQSVRGEADGARWRSIPVPAPLPFQVRPTVARAGDYLWLASHERMLEAALKVHAGERPGLKGAPEFQRLARGLPQEGNSFAFVSHRFAETLWQVQDAMLGQAVQGGGQPPTELFRKLLGLSAAPASFAVSRVGPEGLESVGQGTQDPASILVSAVVVAPTAVVAGMLMPALAQARSKATAITCVNHLKQIGLAARIYAVDHDDTLPMDWLAMKHELVTPRVLFCPADPKKPDLGSLTWDNIDPARVSYLFLKPGLKDTDATPDLPVFRCRIHGAQCLFDGSVHMGTGRRP